MGFFTSAINILQTLVVAIGAGLGVWGVINLIGRLWKCTIRGQSLREQTAYERWWCNPHRYSVNSAS